MKHRLLPMTARWLAAAAVISGCGLFGYEQLESLAPPVAVEHCGNQQLDGDELGLDCGGLSCPACALGVACTPGPGCGEPPCLDSSCAPPSCADGIQNQDEAAVDCGGSSCAACPGTSCSSGADCGSLVCSAGSCAAPSCGDGVQNQGEARIDCGGSQCAPCPPTCADAVQNQDETGVDCGGSSCAACPGAQCASGAECASQVCVAASCQPPSCSDGIQNQDEAGVDCGGSACAPCASCSDGVQNRDETGVDCGGASCVACGLNTPPLARLTVTPGVGSFEAGSATVFSGDASGSSDLQEPASALSYSWDWENDGVQDATGPLSTHSYGAAGTYEVRLTVQDSGGLRATRTFLVVVAEASNVVLVTTAVDEGDAGAAPGNPQGAGLSLREAMQYANATAGKQSILVPAGFTILLERELPVPADAAGVDIVGDGASVDGAGAGPADDCFVSTAPATRIFGLEIRNCPRSPLRLGFGAAGSHFSRLRIQNFSVPVILNDVNVTFGPDNHVSDSSGDCLDVIGGGATVYWNQIDSCATRGIDLTGSSSGALLLGNVVTRSDPGVFLGNGANDCVLVHNVFHANAGDGVWLAGVVNSGDVLRNNGFSGNAGFGLRADNAPFASNDHNAYSGNALGACSGCASLGEGSLTSDPAYLDAASNDFRLSPASPNLDAGIDTGHDVNGPEPGNGLFNGSNPDIGAREMN